MVWVVSAADLSIANIASGPPWQWNGARKLAAGFLSGAGKISRDAWANQVFFEQAGDR